MAWPVIEATRKTLAGDFTVTPTATAWYGGRVTVEDLEVVAMDVSSSLADQVVRTQVDNLVVDDAEGTLVPYKATDELAPYGQQVQVGVSVDSAEDADAIPVGTFIIANSTPNGSWMSYRGEAVPTGGTVTLQVQDMLQDLIESELPGLMQPLNPTTTAGEIRRLCAGICPVNTKGLPGDVAPVKRGTVYDDVRLNAIMSLLQGSSAIARASRTGALEFFTLPTVSSKTVTLDSGNWVGADMALDRQGVYNTVVAGNDQADYRIQGVAQEKTGAFSALGPLKPRVYRHTSPLYTSNSKAAAGAVTKLKALQQERSLKITVRMPLDPSVDCGDLHTVSLVPGSLEPPARVTELQWSPFRAEMTVTYSIARSEVEQWARPTILLRR